MNARDRATAWIVTGPIGHLWSVLADVAVLFARYGWTRVQRRLAGAGSRSSRRR